MILRQVPRVPPHQLLHTAIIVPIVTLFIQLLDPLLSVTTIIDEQFDFRIVETQNQETAFDYIIGEGKVAFPILKLSAQNMMIFSL